MPKYPKIKFIPSCEIDTKNAISFIKRRKGQNWFVKRFLHQNLQYILRPGFNFTLQKKILKAYTENFYQFNSAEIVKGTNEARKNWLKVEKQYYKLIGRIFYGKAWPKGNYRAYASIWWMFPRNVKGKEFFFPFKHNVPKFSNCVIAHEVLHFMFFDYVKAKYGLEEDQLIKGKPANYLWGVSEVFNNTIEHWLPYKKIFKRDSRPYPGLEKMYVKMKKDWQQKQDIDWLLDKWLK